MSKTILIIDDDKLIRKGLSDLLENKGFTVEEAADGKEGLKKALELKPDLVVTDIKMPELDGFQLVEKLREDAAGKSLRVIILTADETTGTLNTALQAGVTVYIAKDHLAPEAMAEQIATAAG